MNLTQIKEVVKNLSDNDLGELLSYVKELKKIFFTVYWTHGVRQVMEGTSIEEAFRNAGLGGGATRGVDFYENGDKDDYDFNNETRNWDRKIPLVISQEEALKFFVVPKCRTCQTNGTPKEVTEAEFEKASEKENTGGAVFAGNKRSIEVFHACDCYDEE